MCVRAALRAGGGAHCWPAEHNGRDAKIEAAAAAAAGKSQIRV